MTASPSATLSETPTLTATASATLTETATATATASLTPSATIPAETLLVPLIRSDFNNPFFEPDWDSSLLYLQPSEGAFAIRFTQTAAMRALTLDQAEAAIEARVQVNDGAVVLTTHLSTSGLYRLTLNAGGLLTLQRNTDTLGMMQASVSPGAWHTLRFSATAGVVRGWIDGNLVFEVSDPIPLPPGKFAVMATGITAGDIWVDDVSLFGAQPFPTEPAVSAMALGVQSFQASAFAQTFTPIVVFTSNRSGNYEIYRMNPDGSGQTALAINPADDFHPALSPDGSRIAFTSARGGIQQVYVMNADGSNLQQLTTGSGSQPAWSPDGTQITFAAFRTLADGPSIYVMSSSNGESSGVTRLTRGSEPSWSPDGNWIAFHGTAPFGSGFAVMSIRPDGTQPRVHSASDTTRSQFDPMWSPDGTRLVYEQVFSTMEDVGGVLVPATLQQIVQQGIATNTTIILRDRASQDPAYSPDSQQVLFTMTSSGSNIARINVDGQGVVQLTSDSQSSMPNWGPAGSGFPPPTPAPNLTFVRAVNLGSNTDRTVDGRLFVGETSANGFFGGNIRCNSTIGLTPEVIGDKSEMIRCGRDIGNFASQTLATLNQTNGTYQVYFTVFSTGTPSIYNVQLQGQTFFPRYATGISDATGRWNRIGPFQTVVTNGQISIGIANVFGNNNPILSGIEIWSSLPPALSSPTTSLNLHGADAYLKSLMFWAIYFETSSDRYVSATGLTNLQVGSTNFTSFLRIPFYCVPGALPGDNAQLGEVFNPVEDYQPSDYYVYIRHCPYDHRYMMAQAIINAFLNYERRGSEPYVYLYENFSATFGRPDNSIWSLDRECVSNQYGTTYVNASEFGNETAARWLDLYTQCILTSNVEGPTLRRVRSAYATTIIPQIERAVQDFYVPRDFTAFQGFEYTDDPTHGAFQVKDANLTGDVLTTCVGGCQEVDLQGNLTGAVLTSFIRSPGANLGFSTSASFVTQQDIDEAYALHIQQLRQYQPAYSTVLQPVLVLDVDESGAIVGYLWISKVYQRSANLIHIPRALP